MQRFNRAFLLPLLFLVTGCPFKNGDTEAGPQPTPPPGSNPGVITTAENGETYFNSTVKPLLQVASCTSCHALPFQGGSAPYTLGNYTVMRTKLKNGTTDDNDLLRYLQGTNGHNGGQDRCNGNPNNSPCFEVKVWCAKEDCSGGTSGSNPIGKVTAQTAQGVLKGWARDPDNVNQAVNVEIYANGPRGSGNFLATVVANQIYASAEISGNVGFEYQLPAAYVDGAAHTYYVYAQDTQSATQFSQVALSPKTATSYSPRAAALAKWNNDVLPTLNSSCTGCHGSWTFTSVLYSGFLDSNGVPAGATTNSFYRKITGGISHSGGGNFCNGNNLCANMQSAYTLQFN